MQKSKSVMDYEPVLPPDFDGTFHFTNSSKEDFIGIWGGKQYLFPAESTVPLVMMEHSPVEIQQIRKKFARDYAEWMFYQSKSYNEKAAKEGSSRQRTFSGIHQAETYTLKDLEPYIKSCLVPLKESRLVSKPAPKATVESKLHTKEDGSFSTEAIDKRTSLKKKALES